MIAVFSYIFTLKTLESHPSFMGREASLDKSPDSNHYQRYMMMEWNGIDLLEFALFRPINAMV